MQHKLIITVLGTNLIHDLTAMTNSVRWTIVFENAHFHEIP